MRIALLVLAACGAATAHPETVLRFAGDVVGDTSGARGGDVSVSGGAYGLTLLGEVQGEGFYRTSVGDPGRHPGAGIDIGARISLFGWFAEDHRLEHWLDLGAEGGGGSGVVHTSRFDTFGRGWFGGWVELAPGRGLWYPAIQLRLDRVTYTSPYDSATTFSIGLSLVHREAVEHRALWFQ